MCGLHGWSDVASYWWWRWMVAAMRRMSDQNHKQTHPFNLLSRFMCCALIAAGVRFSFSKSPVVKMEIGLHPTNMALPRHTSMEIKRMPLDATCN